MTAVVSTSNNLTMSSLRIAELTGKRHDHVLRDIRKMLTDIHGEGGVPSFEDTRINPQNNQAYPCFLLDEAHTLTLLTGYDAKARFAVTNEWLLLKRAPPALDLNDPTQLRTLLLGHIEKEIELQAVITEQAPKVAALERISVGEGSLVPREAAKCINTTQTRLYDWLLEHKWCYREASTDDRKGRLRAYAARIASGDLEERLVSAGYTRDGVEQYKAQVYVTPKGQTKLARHLSGEQEREKEQGVINLAVLNDLATAAAKIHGFARVFNTIQGFGASRLAHVKHEDYGTLAEALRRLVAEPF